MNQTNKSYPSYRKQPRILAAILAAGLCAFGLTALAQTEPAAPAAGLTNARAAEAKSAIQETGQEALNKVEVLWQRIDEKRLKNRTPDELVAWVIMGLLVGGMLYRVGKHGQMASIVWGLVGAFFGGILAHLTQLNLGLGPVLITYEDLLCSLIGGLLILGGLRWFKLLKVVKGPLP